MGRIRSDVHGDKGIRQSVGVLGFQLFGFDHLHVEANLRWFLIAGHPEDFLVLFVGNFKCILNIVDQTVFGQLFVITANVVEDFE